MCCPSVTLHSTGLTRFQYLRDDDEKLKEKRLEYNTRLDKLHRRKLGLKRSWINVVNKRSKRFVVSCDWSWFLGNIAVESYFKFMAIESRPVKFSSTRHITAYCNNTLTIRNHEVKFSLWFRKQFRPSYGTPKERSDDASYTEPTKEVCLICELLYQNVGVWIRDKIVSHLNLIKSVWLNLNEINYAGSSKHQKNKHRQNVLGICFWTSWGR